MSDEDGGRGVCSVLVIVRLVVSPVCQMKSVDVVFALDSSTNISPMAFWHQVKFVRDVTVGLDIGFDRTRIGVVMYSDKVRHVTLVG